MFDAALAEEPTTEEAPAARRRLVDFNARPRAEGAPKPAPAPRLPPRLIEGEDARAKIVEAIEAMRPRLQMDGGDCEFVGIVDNVVQVRLSGACVGCKLSSMTMVGVRMKLTEALGFLVRVAPV